MKEYTRAIEIDTHYGIAHNLLGGALRKSGKLQEAIDEFTKAVELDPGSPILHCNLGMALANVGRGTDAIKEYRKSLGINPRMVCRAYQPRAGTGALRSACRGHEGIREDHSDLSPFCHSVARFLAAPWTKREITRWRWITQSRGQTEPELA